MVKGNISSTKDFCSQHTRTTLEMAVVFLSYSPIAKWQTQGCCCSSASFYTYQSFGSQHPKRTDANPKFKNRSLEGAFAATSRSSRQCVCGMAGSKQNLRLFAVALPRFEQVLNFWWLESVLIVLVFQFSQKNMVFMLRRDPIGSYRAHLARPLADHVTQPWKPRRCGANSMEKFRFCNLIIWKEKRFREIDFLTEGIRTIMIICHKSPIDHSLYQPL